MPTETAQFGINPNNRAQKRSLRHARERPLKTSFCKQVNPERHDEDEDGDINGMLECRHENPVMVSMAVPMVVGG